MKLPSELMSNCDIRDKSHRGNASQFFIAGELCRRGLVAVVTMGNCPNTDILCSNKAGTAFVHMSKAQEKVTRPLALVPAYPDATSPRGRRRVSATSTR